jgi:hypothetical protein
MRVKARAFAPGIGAVVFMPAVAILVEWTPPGPPRFHPGGRARAYFSNALEYFAACSVFGHASMNKSTAVYIFVLVVLAALYARFWTDWFSKPTIQILAQIRPTRNVKATPGLPATYPVSFAFERKFEFTEVKVVSVDDELTNKYPHPLWHLISDSNSVPRKALIYGEFIRGMKPKVPRARPEPLAPDVRYRLYLTAGKHKGKIDFKTLEATEAADQ